MTPFVTFVVPVYNAEKTLRKCLDSLVCQTQQNIEVLLVNDGSSDSSESIAKEYTERYPQLFSLINKENGGVSSARNLGIEIAKGEYLGFIDSDDYVDPDFAELMYKKAKETDADIVVCPVSYEIGDTVKRRYYNKSRFGRTVREDPYILFRSNAYSVNKIIRRSYFLEHGFRYENHMFEDSGLLYNVMLLANRIECVNIPFYHYITVREDSATNLVDESLSDIFISMDSIISFFREHGALDELYDAVEYLCVRHIFKRIDTTHSKKAVRIGLWYTDKAVKYLDEHFPENEKKLCKKLAFIKTHKFFLRQYAAGFSFGLKAADDDDFLGASYYSEEEITETDVANTLARCGNMVEHDIENLLRKKEIIPYSATVCFRKEKDRLVVELPSETDCDKVAWALERIGYRMFERTLIDGKAAKETYYLKKLVIEVTYGEEHAGKKELIKYHYTRTSRRNKDKPDYMIFLYTGGCELSEDTVLEYADRFYTSVVLVDSKEKKTRLTRHPRIYCRIYENLTDDDIEWLRKLYRGDDSLMVYGGNLTPEMRALLESNDKIIITE